MGRRRLEATGDARDNRREIARAYHFRLRKEAITRLGGKCPKCMIEDDPRDLVIIPVEESKLWSLVVLYRRVAQDPDGNKLARLLCKKCRFNEVNDARLRAHRAAIDPNEGTGEFYWVAGFRVEQMRRRHGQGTGLGAGMAVVHPVYEDRWE